MYMYVINHRSIKCSSRTKCLNVVTAVSTLVRRSTHCVTNIKSAAYCYSINYKKKLIQKSACTDNALCKHCLQMYIDGYQDTN